MRTGIATSPNYKTPVPGGGMYLPTTDQDTRQASLSSVARKALKAPQAMISKSFFLRSIGSFKTTDDEVGKKKTDDGRSYNGRYTCDEEVTQQYHHDVFSMPKVPGPRRRSVFDAGCQR